MKKNTALALSLAAAAALTFTGCDNDDEKMTPSETMTTGLSAASRSRAAA